MSAPEPEICGFQVEGRCLLPKGHVSFHDFCGTGRLVVPTPDGEREPDETWFACLTGDCAHEMQVECNGWIRAELLAQAKDAHRLGQTVEQLRSDLATARARLALFEEYANASEYWSLESHDRQERRAWISERLYPRPAGKNV